MQKLNTSQVSLFLSFIIASIFLPQMVFCQTTNDTISENKNDSDTIQVPYEELELDCLCVPKYHCILVTSNDQLDNLFYNFDNGGCKKSISKEFDFSKEAIFGLCTVLTRIGKKVPTIDISILKIPTLKKYICKVVIKEPGCLPNTRMPFPIVKKILFPIDGSDWDFEVVIIDPSPKNRITQTDMCCDKFYRNRD